MNLTTLANMVEKSRLLTTEERRYWKNMLPSMSDVQCAKLERILGEATGIAWTKKTDEYISTIAKGQTSSHAS